MHQEHNGGGYDWSIETQSTIHSAFYYGYAVSQLPGSLLAQHYGARICFGIPILITSILAVITPQAAQWGVAALVAVRSIQGIVQGSMFSANNIFISRWIPATERSRCVGFIYTGAILGNFVAMSVCGILADSEIFGGWPSCFYVFGGLGFLTFLLYLVLVYDTPADHPYISDEELMYIQSNQRVEHIKLADAPWLKILSSVHTWSLALAYSGYLWGLYTLMTEIPTYFANVLHMDVKLDGVSSSLPYIFEIVFSFLGSYIADKLLECGKYSVNFIRKLMNTIASFGSGVCLLAVAFIGCQPTFTVVLLCAGMSLHSFIHSGSAAAIVDVPPMYTGPLSAVVNTFSNVVGFLAPYVSGRLTSSGQTLENWRWVFIIVAVVSFITNIIFLLFGTAEPQSWGPRRSKTVPEMNNSTVRGEEMFTEKEIESNTVL